MKKILSLFLALALLCSLLVLPAAAAELPAGLEDVAGKVVILHTNDSHGRDVAGATSYGTAAVAQLKKDLQAAGAEVLLFSAGDAAQGTPLVNLDMGATALQFLELAGYDAMIPGNHEFDWGTQNLLDIVAENITFPILAANVFYDEENPYGGEADTLLFDAHYIFELEDVKVGVFGLDTPETFTKTHPDKVAGTYFLETEELYAAAQAEVDALKDAGCDLIIAMGHLGSADESTGNRSEDVIANTTGIDLFIDGHSHDKLPTGEEIDGVLRVSAHEHLKTIGTVVYDPEDGSLTAKLLDIVDGAKEYTGLDAEVDAAVNARNEEVEAELMTVIGKTDILLYGKNTTDPAGVRVSETNMGDFATDALLWSARKTLGENAVDAALTNGGGIRDSINIGDITMKDMVTVFPFGNTLTTVTVTGAQLLEALEAATFSTPGAIGAFPQVSGIDFTVVTSVPYEQGAQYPKSTYYAPAKPGSRVIDVTVGGEALDLAKTYVIATNDFTAAGGDTYGVFQGLPTVNTGIAMEQALVDYMAEIGTIGAEYAVPQGRITVIPPDVAAGQWYTDGVIDVMQKGIMAGNENGFDPTASVTRATVFQTLYNMAGKPAAATAASFTDVAADAWYAASAAWAEENGLATGTGDGLYSGDRVITRQEIATILYRGLDAQDIAPVADFVDADEVADWAADAVGGMVALGVITGKDGNRLDPNGTAVRSELALMLARYTSLAPASAEATAAFVGTVETVDKYGNLTTDILGDTLAEAGYEPGDVLAVTIGDASLAIPYGTNYSDVDTGNTIVRNPGAERALIIAINMGNFAETYDVEEGDAVTIAMGEKGGYHDGYLAHQIQRTNERDDYASDEVFANFRNVTVGEIGEGKLYRSSSPVNNELGRAAYADDLIEAAGVATVVNLADGEAEMEKHLAAEGFDSPYYKGLYEGDNVILLNMGVDFNADAFKAKLAEGLRFLAAQEGPYLIHCTEGKDRAGFVIALLEMLMGADAEEIKADYMVTYINYYNVPNFDVVLGSEKYDIIAEGNILESVRMIAGLEKGADLADVDLAAAAADYLTAIGLSEAEITAIQTNLR